MIDERAISTAAADAITDDNRATYDQTRAEHPGLDWAGHDNRVERTRRRLEPLAAIPFRLELMTAPVIPKEAQLVIRTR